MFVLTFFWMSSLRGTVSKALLISIVNRRVLSAGLGTFRPPCTYCVSVVRSVVVEYKPLERCCVGERGNCAEIVLRLSLSRILIGLHNKEIGQCDEGYVQGVFFYHILTVNYLDPSEGILTNLVSIES